MTGKMFFDIYEKLRRALVECKTEKLDEIIPYYLRTEAWLDEHLGVCDQCRAAESEDEQKQRLEDIQRS